MKIYGPVPIFMTGTVQYRFIKIVPALPSYQILNATCDMVPNANAVLSMTLLTTLHPKQHHDGREEAD